MARITGPKCRLCRREGEKLFLKGIRCHTAKCAIAKRAYPAGQHGRFKRRKASDFGRQLREKQKAKRSYGVLERQFRRFYALAERQKGNTGENLLRLLERRLDNVLFVAGFMPSRALARQFVTHGHVQVNGVKCDIPSRLVRQGDKVSVRQSEKRKQLVDEWHKEALSTQRGIASWLAINPEQQEIQVLDLPKATEFSVPIQANLIVELCSK